MRSDATSSSAAFEECAEECAPDPARIAQFERAVRAVSGKWKIAILAALLDGPRRFGELRRAVPEASRHMLTEHLRELATDGLVHRTPRAERVRRVDYELTRAGYALLPVLRALRDWSDTHGTSLGGGR